MVLVGHLVLLVLWNHSMLSRMVFLKNSLNNSWLIVFTKLVMFLMVATVVSKKMVSIMPLSTVLSKVLLIHTQVLVEDARLLLPLLLQLDSIPSHSKRLLKPQVL